MKIIIKPDKFKRQEHGFIVDSPGHRGFLTIDTKGKVTETIPPFKHFIGLHWKEVEIYCRHMPGWDFDWIGDY